MNKWEYMTFCWTVDSAQCCFALNEFGSQGWELVQVVNNIAIMKKKVANELKEKENPFSDDSFVDIIYGLYPTKCPKRGASLGKSRKDKERIKRLLKTYTKEQIEAVVKKEVNDKYNKEYMQNFSTFLNNFPDPTLVEVESEVGRNTNELKIGDIIYR